MVRTAPERDGRPKRPVRVARKPRKEELALVSRGAMSVAALPRESSSLLSKTLGEMRSGSVGARPRRGERSVPEALERNLLGSAEDFFRMH